jgi:hypothetical protein
MIGSYVQNDKGFVFPLIPVGVIHNSFGQRPTLNIKLYKCDVYIGTGVSAYTHRALPDAIVCDPFRVW